MKYREPSGPFYRWSTGEKWAAVHAAEREIAAEKSHYSDIEAIAEAMERVAQALALLTAQDIKPAQPQRLHVPNSPPQPRRSRGIST